MKKLTILAIEDSQAIRRTYENFFKTTEYDLITAENGVEGMEMVVNHQPDLILCDLQLPKMNGIDVTDRLTAHPKTSHIPIIIVSCYNDKNTILQAMNHGATDYIVKPFQFSELLERIKNAFVNAGLL